MDATFYKNLKTSRGMLYSYYQRAPTADVLSSLDPNDPPLPALLFLHGFPTSSRLWKHQISFFLERGFTVCAPDLLGLGNTSKPTDTDAYRSSLMCKDIVEILEAETMDRVIAIGHDLGSKIVSRMANFFPERFIAYAFLAAPYSAPRPMSKIDYTLRMTKKMCGYELCGHLLFYAEDDADQLIENRLDSFFSAIFPDDPKMGVTQVAPIGALKSWLQRGDMAKLAPYIEPEDLAMWRNTISQEGIRPALCWHKALVTGINADDDKPIALDRYPVDQPVFFGSAIQDYFSPPVLGIATTNYHCQNATIREFQDGHWLMLSSPNEVNTVLFSWIMDCI